MACIFHLHVLRSTVSSCLVTFLSPYIKEKTIQTMRYQTWVTSLVSHYPCFKLTRKIIFLPPMFCFYQMVKWYYYITWPFLLGKPSCRVVEQRSGINKDCILPFTYKNKERTGCINDEQENGKYWCPTAPSSEYLSDVDVRFGKSFWPKATETCETFYIWLQANSGQSLNH